MVVVTKYLVLEAVLSAPFSTGAGIREPVICAWLTSA